MNRRWLLCWVIALAVAAIGGPAAAGETLLRVATLGAIESFDPDAAHDAAGVAARDAVYDGLVGYAPNRIAIVGRLAARWSISDDLLSYTFTLRPGLTFHDGTQVTSADVRASFARRMALGGELARRLDGVAAMEAPDAAIFVLRLRRPQPWLLDVLAGAWGPKVLSSAALAAHGGAAGAAAWLRTHDAGSGPYRLAGADAGGARLERFAAYWGKQPWFASIDIAAIPDAATAALRLRAGRLDAVSNALLPAATEGLPPRFAVSVLPNLGLIEGAVNPLGLLAGDDARRAALTAINPRYWLNGAFRTLAAAAGGLFPSGVLEPLEPVDLPNDLSGARRTVERLHDVRIAIGYKMSQTDLLSVPVDLMVSDLRAIGFDATAAALPDASVATFARHPTDAPDLFLICATPGEADPQVFARQLYVGDAPGNVFGLIDPTAARLARQAEAADGRTAMQRQYQLLSQKLFDGGGFVPVAELPGLVVHRRELSGFATHAGFPLGAFDYAMVTGSE